MNSPACLRIPAATRRNPAARSAAFNPGHGPSSNARRAAPTAASTSTASPAAATANTSLVEGFNDTNDSAVALARKAPSM